MSVESQYRIDHQWHSLSCPHCNRFFKVNRDDLFPIDYYLFSCLTCHESFWAAFDKDKKIEIWTAKPAGTHPLSAIAINEEVVTKEEEKICPHCFCISTKSVKECHQCGLSFYDSKWIQKLPYASYSLRKAYEYLLKNFDSIVEHKKFVKRCISENNMMFGISCYGQFLKEKPKNPYSLKMLKHFESLIFSNESNKMTKNKPASSSVWSYKMGWLHSMLVFFLLASMTLIVISYQLLSPF